MAEPQVEAAWRAEFRRVHDATNAIDGGNVFLANPTGALRWSGDKAEVRRLEDDHTHHFLRWTFLSTVAVMIVGLIGVGLSFIY
jgi:hypothetical protein